MADCTVKPYLILPLGRVAHPAWIAAIPRAMQEVQAWYAIRAGCTFSLDSLQLVTAIDPYDKDHPNLASVVNRAINGPDEHWEFQVCVVVFCAGAGGFAHGTYLPELGVGHIEIGDWGIEALSGIPNPWGLRLPPGSPYAGWNAGCGTFAHEAGHGLAGLVHPDPPARSIMLQHTEYPDIGFLPNEVTLLRASPFLNVPVPERLEVRMTIFPHPPRIMNNSLFAPGSYQEVQIAGLFGVPGDATVAWIRLSVMGALGRPIGQAAIVQWSKTADTLDGSLGHTTQSAVWDSESGPVLLNNGCVYVVAPKYNNADITVCLDLQGYS